MDRDSDLTDESDEESEDVWELSGNSVEDDPIDASNSESEEVYVRANNKTQRRGRGHPYGPARGGLGAARAGTARARGGFRLHRGQEDLSSRTINNTNANIVTDNTANVPHEIVLKSNLVETKNQDTLLKICILARGSFMFSQLKAIRSFSKL